MSKKQSLRLWGLFLVGLVACFIIGNSLFNWLLTAVFGGLVVSELFLGHSLRGGRRILFFFCLLGIVLGCILLAYHGAAAQSISTYP